MSWTEEKKQQVIDMYMEGGPTPENSTELCKQIAEELEESANGVRMVLIASGKYVKKGTEPTKDSKGTGKTTSDKAPRVSKESQIKTLKDLISGQGKDVDDDILDKLTGKAAAYFTKILT